MKYQIKNWDKFQQYKDDRPVHWIKLHVELLDDFHFEELPELDQLYILKLWLFAAKNKGCFEGTDKFIARKIGASKLNMDKLVRTGFIVRTEKYETVPREEKRREEENREEKRGFTKPTLENVKSYASEKNLNIAGFYDYYESNGWKVGKNSMKDWQAAANGWSGRQGNFGGKGQSTKQKPERNWAAITGGSDKTAIEGEFTHE